MPIVKFDVSGTDPKDAFSGGGKQPTPGVYKVKIKELKPGFRKGDNGQPDKTAPRLEVVAEIVSDKKFKGAVLYDYIAFSEASQWKMDQFLQVFGLASNSKRKGSFDTSKIVNKTTKVRVVGDTYNGDYRAKLGSYLLDDDGAGSDEPDDEPEDDGEDSGDEQTWAELGEAADNDDEEAISTLTEYAGDAELDPNDFDTWAELATALEEAEAGEETGDEDTDADEGGEDGYGNTFADLGEKADDDDEEAVNHLTELAEAAELDPEEYPTWTELAEALKEAKEADEAGEEPDPDDEEDTPPYTEWSTADLKAELANRGLEATSKKADMVAALEADDEEDPF